MSGHFADTIGTFMIRFIGQASEQLKDRTTVDRALLYNPFSRNQIAHEPHFSCLHSVDFAELLKYPLVLTK